MERSESTACISWPSPVTLYRFQVLLERMFGVSGDGVSDHLIRYSQPVTSSYWFAPSREDLEKVCSLDTKI